tara:strand:+ start:225 stop:1229 length:1005 start_codon:yes stop_codon:yes gene_type:complete
MNGTDPTALSENAFSGSGGSASGGYWVVTNSTYTITPTASNYTILAGFKYTTAPDTDEVLMKLDNGNHTVSVKANGNGGVKLVGASTATFSSMDFGLTDSTSVVPTLRLTLDSAGTAKLYRDELINDDEGEQDFISVTGASGSSKSIQFGNTTGNVSWASVYVCHDGSFAPDELMRSDFAQDNHIRMALSIVETLRNSERFYLKTHVDNASIKYAYDISEDTLNKTTPPTIHVLLNRIDSPNFSSLGGVNIDQSFDISIFVTTRAINYENAFLLCMNITGEVFDELYTETGLNPTTDNLESFSADLDYKARNEDVICTHRLTLGYRRRLKMTRR